MLTLRHRHMLQCLAALLVFGHAALPRLSLPPEQLSARFEDDAYYYFAIARQAAQGNGLSFDGEHLSNGFQPLWQLLLLPVFYFCSDPILALRWVVLLEASLLALAAFLVAGRPRLSVLAALLAALVPLTFPGSTAVLLRGMESALFLALLCLVWALWERVSNAVKEDGVPKTGPWWGLGIALALTALARLEAVILLPLVGLFCIEPLRRWQRLAIPLLAPSAIVLGSYLLFNRVVFDLWFPVSGLVKLEQAAWATTGLRVISSLRLPYGYGTADQLIASLLNRLGLPAAGLALWFLLLPVLIFALWRWRRHWLARLQRLGLAFPVAVALAVFAFGQLSLHALNGVPWKQVPQLLFLSCLAALLANSWPRLAGPAAVAAILICWIQIVAGNRFHSRWLGGQHELAFTKASVSAARTLEHTLPPETRVGSWNAGALGYFAPQTIVNLDGLVNDARFLRQVVQQGELGTYLSEEDIHWAADLSCEDGAPPAMLALRRQSPEPCRFLAHKQLSPASAANGGCTLQLWKIDCAADRSLAITD